MITAVFVNVRRCQLAPSTTRVCPEMKRAKGGEERRGPAELLHSPDP